MLSPNTEEYKLSINGGFEEDVNIRFRARNISTKGYIFFKIILVFLLYGRLMD
mgnify:CR=1 FL=1